MSDITVTASFGLSPVGTERVEHDWDEDEYGFRELREYTVIPGETVAPFLEWSRVPFKPEVLLEALDGASHPEEVVQISIVVPDTASFLAMGWTRTPEAVKVIREFLESAVR